VPENANTDVVPSPPAKKPRLRPKFSLRTFLISMLVIASAGGLWWRWEPWSFEKVLQDRNGAVRGAVWAAVYSSDGRMIATAAGDGRIYDADSGRQLAALTGFRNGLIRLVFSHDGRLLASSGSDMTVRIWEAATGRQIHAISDKFDFASVAFSADDRFLITINFSRIQLWDVGSGSLARTLTDESQKFCRIVAIPQLSADGKKMLLGFSDNYNAMGGENGIAIVDLDSGKTSKIQTDHRGKVNAAIFSRDNKHILTGSVDGTACLWDVASGQKIVSFLGHTADVSSVEFSADNERILTASYDHSVRIWNRQGLLLATLQGHRDGVYSAHFSPDGQHILTASNDQTSRLWRRRRPEYAYGIAALPEFWLTILLTSAWFWSMRRDWRTLGRNSNVN
jgi:WD40 repeat protein